MEIREYLENIRRWVLLIVIVTICSTTISGVISYFFLDKVYEATSTIIISIPITESETGKVSNDVPLDANLIRVYSTLIQSDTIMKQIIQELRLKTNIDDLRSEILIEQIESTGIIRITAENSIAQRAQIIVKSLIKDLKYEAKRLNLVGNVNVIDVVQLPVSPVRPNPLLNMFIAAVAGIMVGIILAFLFEYMDNSIKSLPVLQKVSGLPILCTIPVLSSYSNKLLGLIHKKNMIVDTEETYKILRTRVNALCMRNSLRVILVTSPAFSEGKTTIAANLAASLEKLGKKVLLLDCNLRNPRIQDALHLVAKKGITDFLIEGEDTSFETCNIANTYLRVIISGPKPVNPTELLESPKMIAFIELMKLSYDMIIIDSPPVLPFADTCILSRLVEGIILVVSYRRSTYESVAKTIESLNTMGANILGIAVNKIPVKR